MVLACPACPACDAMRTSMFSAQYLCTSAYMGTTGAVNGHMLNSRSSGLEEYEIQHPHPKPGKAGPAALTWQGVDGGLVVQERRLVGVGRHCHNYAAFQAVRHSAALHVCRKGFGNCELPRVCKPPPAVPQELFALCVGLTSRRAANLLQRFQRLPALPDAPATACSRTTENVDDHNRSWHFLHVPRRLRAPLGASASACSTTQESMVSNMSGLVTFVLQFWCR